MNLADDAKEEVDLTILGDHYLTNAIEEFKSNCANNKIIDILNFRIKYRRYYKFPELLFYFDTSIDFDISSSISKIIRYQKNKKDLLPISNYLKKCFPDVDCIIDFFCYSTFPSMYGHFSCQEFIENGFNFIQLNIDDILISPFLICSYFLHSNVFQDRLVTIFYTNFIDRIIKKNEDKFIGFDFQSSADIKDIFIDSFHNSLSYLSKFHFDLVNQFRAKYPELAVFTFSEIIKRILKLWKYFTFFEEGGISDKPKFCLQYSPKRTNYIYKHIYKNIMESIQKEDIERILDLFNGYSYFYEYANYMNVIYKNNFYIIFSESDIEVINKISSSLANKEIDKTNMTIDQFILGSMKIKEGQCQRNFNNEKLIELKKLPSEQFHERLTKISGELPKLHFYTVHSTRILKLKLYNYAEKVLFYHEKISSISYPKKQIFLYALTTFQNSAGKGIAVNPLSFDFNISLITSEKSKQRKNNYLIGKTVIDYVFNKANSLIQESNKNDPDSFQVSLNSTPSLKNIPPFISSVDDIAWYLTLLKLSPKKIDILLNDKIEKDDEKVLDVQKFVSLYTNEYTNEDMKVISSLEIEVASIFENLSEIGGLIDISNKEMKIEFEQGDGLFNFGKKIRVFMRVHESIVKSIKKTLLSKQNNNIFIYFFLYTAFYGEQISNLDDTNMMLTHLLYFKFNLIISLYIIKKIIFTHKVEKDNYKIYVPLRVFEAEERLKALMTFFNMKDVNIKDDTLSLNDFL